MELITCKDASFGYDTGIVIRELNFTIEAGDYLCIVGENGSGKSTLMKGLLGLKTPAGGTLVRSSALGPGEIGYLPQQTAAQKDFPASVMEVVLSGLQSRKKRFPFYTKQEKETARAALKQLGIADLHKHCYRELSGGQQQRTLLARALCATGTLLILDEPVTGLDPLAAQELYGLIRMLNREKGLSIVMVSHDAHNITADATHILHLAGRQLFFGTTAQYRETDLAKGFLGGTNL